MKRTTTQWTTTTTRTTQGRQPKLSAVDMAELDAILDGTPPWEKVIAQVDKMPLNLARRLRQRLEELFT